MLRKKFHFQGISTYLPIRTTLTSVVHHGDWLDLAEMPVRSDVVALLLVEAGVGLDDSQLAAPNTAGSSPGHHASQLSKLKQ